MITQTNFAEYDKQELTFPYLDKNEATFLLNAVKVIDCSCCPDFYLGCEGKDSQIVIANMTSKDYLYKQKHGTETFLCGKLRNIVISDEVSFSKLNSSFDASIKNKIGYLTKDFEKCIVNDAGVSLERKNLEISFYKQLQQLVNESNKQILKLQESLQKCEQALNLANITVNKQEQEISRLRNSLYGR